MNFGLPYKGSKNLLAQRILDCIPSASVFVDLFCGGCAVSHAALLSGRFARVVVNDIEGDVSRLFVAAVNGQYKGESRWISREDFFRLKESDPYVRYCWSFGNNGRDYIYSKDVEPYKRALHYAVVFGDFAALRRLCPLVSDAAEKALAGLASRKARRIEFGRVIVRRLKQVGKPEDLKNNPLFGRIRLRDGGVVRKESLGSLRSLQSLQRLERLQSLESLESLESLQSLECLEMDYRDVQLPDGCVVYCDPPYAGTDGYGLHKSAFDQEAFWNWARKCERLLFISEYSAPVDFVPIEEVPHRSRISSTTKKSVTERLFVHESRYNELKTRLI